VTTVREASVKAGCLSVLVVLACGVPSMLLGAHVLRELWGWYVTTTWDVAAPSMPAAYGLVLIARFFSSLPREREEDKDRKLLDVTIRGVLAPPIKYLGLWGFGALVHTCWGPS
jgi:hypothetical protein